MAYLLDANVFIQAKNLHYGFDFCPAFWDWLVDAHQRGIVFSIEKVGNELAVGNDALALWAKARGTTFFLPPSQNTLTVFVTVSEWLRTQQYEPAAIHTFSQLADYYLVAQALAERMVVVTHEVPSGSKKRIKIPDVCVALRVKHMTPYEMLRREKAQFVLRRWP